MKLVAGVLTLLIIWPMTFFLTWSMLKMIGATDLMWFVFWAYIPISLICGLLMAMAQAVEDK